MYEIIATGNISGEPPRPNNPAAKNSGPKNIPIVAMRKSIGRSSTANVPLSAIISRDINAYTQHHANAMKKFLILLIYFAPFSFHPLKYRQYRSGNSRIALVI
jgi:hypothetical protein